MPSPPCIPALPRTPGQRRTSTKQADPLHQSPKNHRTTASLPSEKTSKISTRTACTTPSKARQHCVSPGCLPLTLSPEDTGVDFSLLSPGTPQKEQQRQEGVVQPHVAGLRFPSSCNEWRKEGEAGSGSGGGFSARDPGKEERAGGRGRGGDSAAEMEGGTRAVRADSEASLHIWPSFSLYPLALVVCCCRGAPVSPSCTLGVRSPELSPSRDEGRQPAASRIGSSCALLPAKAGYPLQGASGQEARQEHQVQPGKCLPPLLLGLSALSSKGSR